ncbi:unnamed protein product [Rotaria sp. Silwood2]|nr:unnamed protein product [Rotaria sp. Silwood2]CAF2624278.1 unnamed protein product [Rotaria sp. Silwood2]CAF3048213.1 unnamed protein product [Rotaria sp. Silwood2]
MFSTGECTLYFLVNVLKDVQDTNLRLQKYYTTGVDLHSIITSFICKLNNRLHEEFFGHKVNELLKKIPHSNEVDDLVESFRLFIHSIINYIEKYYHERSSFYKSISIFSETDIDKIQWRSIEQCATFIDNKKIDKDLLYNEFSQIKSKYIELKEKFGGIHKQIEAFIPSNLIELQQAKITNYDKTDLLNEFDNLDHSDTNEDNCDTRFHKDQKKRPLIRCDHLGAYLLNDENVPHLQKLVQFSFSVPASNAFCESIFSHMNFWGIIVETK